MQKGVREHCIVGPLLSLAVPAHILACNSRPPFRALAVGLEVSQCYEIILEKGPSLLKSARLEARPLLRVARVLVSRELF